MVKADMTFRRFLTRGNKNVLVETMLLAMAYNIQKLHCKIQAENIEPATKAATAKYLFLFIITSPCSTKYHPNRFRRDYAG